MGMPNVAEVASQFIHELDYNNIPEDCINVAKRCFVDGIGVILAGSDEPCAKVCREYALSVGGRTEAAFLGLNSQKVPVQLAALVNGTAGHALDWDDTALSKEADRSVLLHPTMQPLAALLALGERYPASGKDLLTAFVAGFEVSCKIAEAIDPSHFSQGRGFHTSGTIGIFGATVAAAKYLKLPPVQIRNALGLAASMSAGIGGNHGTMGKPLHMGRSAENGIVAAKLASLGMDARPEVLEGTRGFFHCFGGGFNPDKIFGRFGNPFAIIEPGVCIKPYPCGVVGHPGMDAMKHLVTTHDVKPEDVASVKVFTGTNVLPPGPLRFSFAGTALEGKFCVQFQMASMIVRRKAGMKEFTDKFVQSPEIVQMQPKIETSVDPAIEALGKATIRFDIEMSLNDGRTISQTSAEHYRGGPENPLTRDSLVDKFLDASQNVLAASQGHEAVALIESLDRLDNATDLIKIITCARRPVEIVNSERIKKVRAPLK